MLLSPAMHDSMQLSIVLLQWLLTPYNIFLSLLNCVTSIGYAPLSIGIRQIQIIYHRFINLLLFVM